MTIVTPCSLRPPAVGGVEVEPVRVRVDFDHRARLGRRGDHGVEVDRVAVAGQQEPARRVAEHRHPRVSHRPDDPRGHLGTRQAERRMDARDDIVEPGEHVVGIVERPVGEDVALGPLEQAELAVVIGSARRSPPTAARTRSIDQAPGVAGRPRVVGDPEILQPRGAGGLGHLFEGCAAVAPVGVTVERPGQVGKLDELGSSPRSAASNSPASSRSSGGM